LKSVSSTKKSGPQPTGLLARRYHLNLFRLNRPAIFFNVQIQRDAPEMNKMTHEQQALSDRQFIVAKIAAGDGGIILPLWFERASTWISPWRTPIATACWHRPRSW
jgi:hypothetical protein